MPPARKSASPHPAGLAARALGRGTALVGVRVARSLYGRWRRMPQIDRTRIEQLAQDVKERALDIRGELDQDVSGQGLKQANERLADAIVESAEADPEIDEIEVRDLRADLARELDRLANAEIRATRGSGVAADEV